MIVPAKVNESVNSGERISALMLTVSDALQLEVLADVTQVVAGKAGLGRRVTWVHNAGVPDAADWLNGGELLLTTAINLPEGEANQRAYMHALIDKGVAALALAIGRYITHAPDYLREIADAHDFPLIEIDYRARFVDVAKAVNQRIAQENLEKVERAFHIHQTLTRLVLEGGDLGQLAARMAELVGQSISIETERFEALAARNIAEVDEARRYTLQYGRTNPQLVAALEDGGYLATIRETLRPVELPKMPEVGLEMERILAPIVVHGAIYGYMWIIADGSPLSDLDRLAIESGATIAALMILHREAAQNAEASLKGSLLAQLIDGERGRESVLTDQALRYGVDLRAPYVLMIVDSDQSAAQLMTLYQRINRLVLSSKWPVIVAQFAGQIVLLAAAGQAATIAERITALGSASGDAARSSTERGSAERGLKPCVAISAVNQGAANVGAAYQQSREALLINARIDGGARVIAFESLGYLHTLYKAGAGALIGNPYIADLRKLHSEQQADLFNTLEVYLDTGGNGVQTAEVLHIHRSTLNYRLDRIEKLCDWKLADPLLRTNLQVALKLLRLFEE